MSCISEAFECFSSFPLGRRWSFLEEKSLPQGITICTYDHSKPRINVQSMNHSMNQSKQLTSVLRLRNPFLNTQTRVPAFTRAMASNAPNAPNQPAETEASTAASQPNGQPLSLPEPPANDNNTTQINVNGDGVKLDHLGPLVVNKDGSLSRIANWDNMAEIEKQNTLRILGKRNQLRLSGLKGEEDGKTGQSEK